MPIVVTPVPQSRFVSLTYNQIILGTTSAVVKGYWPLDERDDSTVVDLSTLNNDLSRPIDTPYITGQVNEGIRYTQTANEAISGGSFDYGNGTFLDGGSSYGNWSMEVWVNVNKVEAAVALLSLVDGNTFISLALKRNTDGGIGGEFKPFGISVSQDGVLGSVDDVGSMNSWHHVVISSGNADGWRIYLDGGEVAFDSRLPQNLTSLNITTVLIGATTAALPPIDGNLDEAVVYDGIISAADVLQHYNSGITNAAVVAPMEGYWLLNETSGIIVDNSGNLGNGEYINSPTLGVAGLTKSGTAVDFAGSPVSYIDTHFRADERSAFTLMVWIDSPTAPDTGRSFIMAGGFRAITWSNPTLQFREAAIIKVGGTWYSASFGTLSGNTTYHLTMTYDGSELLTYVNGVLEDTNSTMSGDVVEETDTLLLMQSTDMLGAMVGTLDEPRYYGRTLTGPEILAIYNDRV